MTVHVSADVPKFLLMLFIILDEIYTSTIAIYNFTMADLTEATGEGERRREEKEGKIPKAEAIRPQTT